MVIKFVFNKEEEWCIFSVSDGEFSLLKVSTVDFR